jgi:predicted Fe-Mo cluster-binding NifX family protein
MKTVITASNNTIKATFDKRFGRAAWFCVFDENTKEVNFYQNLHIDASNGAGLKAAEKIIEMKIQKVISGDFGPKAKDLLDKFNIQMVILQDEDLTVGSIIEKLNKK